MIWIAFGRWSRAAGPRYVRTRIYIGGWRWTPFVRVVRRNPGPVGQIDEPATPMSAKGRETTPWFRWHWQNLTQEDDVQNQNHKQALRIQRTANDGFCDPLPVIPPYRRRFPWHGRAWFHFGRRELAYEWCLLKSSRSCGVEWRGSGFSVRLPWLISLYVTMPFWVRPKHPLSLSVHDGGIWWNVFTDEWSSSSRDPRWRRGSFHPLDCIFGSAKYATVDMERRSVVVPMPEGPYQGEARMFASTWTRPRWPWWPLRKTALRCELEVPIGIPHEGKGENGWDCGEDATYGMTAPARTFEEAVGNMVASVLRDRARYGRSEPGAYPHPDVRAQAREERRGARR